MDTEINIRTTDRAEDITTLQRKIKEDSFRIQGLEKRIEKGKKLFGETILRLRSVQGELQKVREEAEKRKFDTVIDKMGDGVVICAPDWRITAINPSARNYLNVSDIKNLNFLDFIFDHFSTAVPRGKLADLSQPRMTFELVREETEQFNLLYLEVSSDVLRDPHKNILSVILTLRDVTEARKEELIKQDFLSLISHKLRTPITVITGNASMIQKEKLGPLNEKQKKVMNAILRSAYSFQSLTEKLIGFTTIERDRLDLLKESIELQSYLPTRINSIVERAENKRIELNIDFLNENVKVNINESYFNLIIENLIENAIKFNDKEIIKINVQVGKMPGKVKISVSDNGRGIPPEEREKIFEKFYQIEKYFTANVEGAGLGLALVKRLINTHGGDIRLESEIGTGSRFTFTLPG